MDRPTSITAIPPVMGMAPSMATPPTDRGVPHLVKRIKPEYNFDFVVRPIAKRQSGYWPLRNRHRQGPAAMRWTPRCSPGAEGRITSCLSPFRNRTPKSDLVVTQVGRARTGEEVMSFKVQVGPPLISIHQGHTVLISEQDGQINWPSEKGLYFLDTRVVSSWAISANGEPWELLNGGAISYYASRIFLTNRSLLTEDGTIAPRTLGLTISRSIRGGMHEDLDVTNNGLKPVRFQLEIALRCDFADVFEVKSGRIVRRGRITTEWSERRQRLSTIYRNRDFTRAVTLSPARSPTKAVYANGRLSFEITLEPGQAWHCCLRYT